MIFRKRISGRTAADDAGGAADAAGAPLARPADARLPNDRLRWGLTGMAAIFLMVLVAAALLKPAARVQPVQPEDSLATLGVAPGSGKEAAGHSETAPAPRP